MVGYINILDGDEEVATNSNAKHWAGCTLNNYTEDDMDYYRKIFAKLMKGVKNGVNSKRVASKQQLS